MIESIRLSPDLALPPDAVTQTFALDVKTNYARSTRNRILGELAAAKLVTTTERGMVRASDKLFD